ncbi:MAG: hypothetical protein JRN24_01430 [Nitrososphaerota archaeon]|nr:hypothetical protein [Nitrososphaerota archaeon]
MPTASVDRSLQDTLSWALERMRKKGFTVKSNVILAVDPKLAIMGYAQKEAGSHKIVISEWALDSEMLGGLVLHELAHIYFTEAGAHSHNTEILEEVLERVKVKEGLRAKEAEYLIDAFNHLQNILVDDIVFVTMDQRELENAKRFFNEWVSERPSGDPVLDSALLCRNAFAIASLRRRRLLGPDEELNYRNKAFLDSLGEFAVQEFEWVESFLENAKPDWTEKEYREALDKYLDRMLSIMRPVSKLDDLR